MHIPDGFLDAKTAVGCAGVAALGLGLAVRKVRAQLSDRMIPFMGVMAAFIFAAQMINFPVAAGTSGHMVGGTLAAVTLGPWAGSIVLTLVLVVQCFIFQDGGITALGANILNLAFIGVWSGYWVYELVSRAVKGKTGLLCGVALGAWISVVLAASACALELGASGLIKFSIALPAMAAVHSIIGIGEAAVTVAAISFIYKTRPDLIFNRSYPFSRVEQI